MQTLQPSVAPALPYQNTCGSFTFFFLTCQTAHIRDTCQEVSMLETWMKKESADTGLSLRDRGRVTAGERPDIWGPRPGCRIVPVQLNS